jgi:hypothetical protein
MQGCILQQLSKILRDLAKQLSEATDFVAFGDSESASAHKLPRPKCTPVYNLIVGL